MRPSLPVLLVVIVAAVAAGGAWLEVRNYQAVRDGALMELSHRAATLAESTASAFKVADTALRSVVVEREERLRDGGGPTEDLRTHMIAVVDAVPQVSGLAIIDAKGRMLLGTSETTRAIEAAEMSVADRDYFRWFSVRPGAAASSDAPFVGQPLRSRLTGAWFLGMSRPVRTSDGSFAGVALAVFSLDWFDAFHAATVLEPETSLVLAARQDVVIDAILPARDIGMKAVGRPLDLVLPGLGIDGLRRQADQAGTPVVWARAEGIAAVAPLPDLPLHVILYRPWPAVLAGWQGQLVSDVGLMALALIALLAMTVPLVRALRDRDRLFELSPDPVCVCDGEGRILRANRAWSRLLAMPPESMIGLRHSDLVIPDDTETVRRAQARLLNGEQVEDLTVCYRQAGGGTVWLAWSAAAEGERMFILARDITHRRAAEDALRASEQRFRDVAEAASEFIWEVSADGSLTYVSRRVRSVLGWNPDEVRGRRLADLMGSEGRRRLEAALRREVPFVIEVAVPRGDGEAWLRLSGQPILSIPGDAADDETREDGFRGAAQDITESRQARQALLNSEARYRGIVNTVVDAIITIDERGIVQSVNPAAERLFGYSAREMIRQNVSMLMPEPVRSQHDGYLRAYIRTGSARVIGAGREVEARRKDGSLFPMDLGLSEVFLDNQRFFIGCCRDLTEHKRVDRLKDEFVATVSHELRTPLTSIRGSLGLIGGGAGGALSPQVASLVTVALANCERLTRLVDDILDIQRIEASDLAFRMVPVDVRAVARRAIVDLRPVIDDAGVRAVVEAEAEEATVQGDFDRLLQMAVNLIANAVKFSPAGGTVTVAVRATAGEVVFSVRDQGPGIPEAFRSRVFDRFSQADGSTTRGQGGSGLGLAIAHGITRRHGGEIGFETSTEAPSGTVFTVRLPRVEAAVDPARDATAAAAAEVLEDGHLSSAGGGGR
jgi:PAS domain S-box-containing protein